MATRKSSYFGAAIATSCLVLVVGRALSGAPSSTRRHATPSERAEIRRHFASREATWRAEARGSFPGDGWSQDDDFQRRESESAREWASRLRVPLSDVLDAIDEGLRVAPFPGESRRATVHACKPRPFYD